MQISNEFIHNLAKEGLKKPISGPYFMATKWLLVMAAYFISLALFYGFREDILQKLTQEFFLIEIIFIFLTIIISTIAASFAALPDLNQKPSIKFLPFIPFVILTAILFYALLNFKTLSWSDCLKSGHKECFLHLIFFSIIPVLFIFWQIKKAAPLKFYLVGAFSGLGVASFSYLLFRLIEKSDEPELLLMWHFLPVALIMAFCAILGKYFFKM